MSKKEKVLILVKAWPAWSKKYGYVICTAGITEDGEWRRLFPIPLSVYLKDKFEKRRWIEVEIIDEKPERRKESRKINRHSIRILDEKEDVESVRRLLKPHITTLERLKEAYREDYTSLGVIKPLLRNFTFDPREKEKNELINLYQQTLFSNEKIKINDIPYWPKYEFYC